LGECVQVAWVANFLRLAEAAGWRAVFLGPAVSIEAFLEAARCEKPDLVVVSYQLTLENGERLLGRFAEATSDLREAGLRFAFAGMAPLTERAETLGFFEKIFDGSESPKQILTYLKEQPAPAPTAADYPQLATERIAWRAPYPILRHDFGLPTMQATIAGIQKIAEAQALDLISLDTDPEAQENFFHPQRQDPRQKGAGGVPVRSPDDFRALYEASRRGNFPMLLAYPGSDDFIRYTEALSETIHNAWGAIPLFWFTQIDGRGLWNLEAVIREHQQVMAWYGQRNIPVELNEPHHWGMRHAPDVIYVVAAFLAAYNAKKYGIRDCIAQMIFNSPPGTSDKMDLAKMLAILELIAPLSHFRRGYNGERQFRIWKQTRIGLFSHPLDLDAARDHLAASVDVQMALKPHIYQIVGHTQAHHTATADDVIEASTIVRHAIADARNAPEMTRIPAVRARAAELVTEACVTLDVIRRLADPSVDDPWADAATLAKAVTSRVLDAPHFKNNPFGLGLIRTKIIDGACQTVSVTGHILNERERLSKFL
jgi:hypothetical protein